MENLPDFPPIVKYVQFHWQIENQLKSQSHFWLLQNLLRYLKNNFRGVRLREQNLKNAAIQASDIKLVNSFKCMPFIVKQINREIKGI